MEGVGERGDAASLVAPLGRLEPQFVRPEDRESHG
jgi:hypothetical protein